MNTKKIQEDERISICQNTGKKRKIQDEEQSISIGIKKRKIQDEESIAIGCQSGKKRKIQEDEYNFLPRKKMKIDKPLEINMHDYIKKRRDLLIYI